MSDTFERLGAALAAQYQIEHELGRGEMAIVYLAHDVKHNRPVAVKVLLPELAASVTTARFLREIEMAAGLAHPNIVPVYDSGQAGEFLYYVMPYLDGQTLRHRLHRDARLPVKEAVGIARDVAGALSYAHRQNIVHRDVKPGNILFIEGHAVVADFGIGKAMCDACDDQITLIGGLVGTPDYMSPEQIGGGDVDPRTDVYSLGCVLFEMLVGDLPYPAENPRASMARHTIDPIPSVRAARTEVSEELEAVVVTALAKTPEDRFQSAREFADALEGAVTGGEHTMVVTKAPGGEAQRRRGVKTLVGAVLGVLVLGIIGRFVMVALDNVPSIERLAVLPFENLSGDAGQEYFVDGMHDLLISELAQIGALSVISRTSVMRYKGTELPVPEIARDLNVDAVVLGAVFRLADSVRINAQLVAVRPERHLWAATYAGTVDEMFALQAQVARAVAAEIQANLTPQDEARLATVRTVDHEVHDGYLQARFHHAKGTTAGLREAIRYYEQVIDQAPDFAPAHAGLALSLHLLGVYGSVPSSETEPQAMMHAEAALELDDELAEALAVLAGIKSMFEWDWEGAEQAYERAITADRSSASARQWYAYHLTSVGRHDEAIAQARRGLELDPLNPMGRVVLADQLVNARRYDEAIVSLERAFQLDPTFDRARDLLEWIYTQQNRYDDAVRLRRERLAQRGASGTAAADLLTRRYERNGATGYWEWRLADLERLADSVYTGPSEFAKIHAALGNIDEALAYIERAYTEHDGVEMLDVWPGYDPLRTNPRFRDIIARLNFPGSRRLIP